MKNVFEVDLDLSTLEFINGPCVLYLKVMLDDLKKNKTKVNCVVGAKVTKAVRFLISSGALDSVDNIDKIPLFKKSPTTLPCFSFRTDERFEWVKFTFLPWLSECTGIPVGEFDQVELAMSEVFNNILEHSGSDQAVTFSQWHPNKNLLQICIGDKGVGILATLSRRFTKLSSDTEAIKKAVQNGVTSQSVPGNRGAGLYTIVDVVTKHLDGDVSIVSKHGYAKFFSDGRINGRNLKGCCNGTLITLSLDTSKILIGTGEEEELW